MNYSNLLKPKKVIAFIARKKRLNEWKKIVYTQTPIELNLTTQISAKLHPYGDITRILYCDQGNIKNGQSFEQKTIELFQSYLKPKSTILDIGANIGLFSIIAAKALKNQANIHAFEPTPATYDILEKNLISNNCICVSTHMIALTNKESTVTMTPPTSAIAEGFSDSFNQIHPVTETTPSQLKIPGKTLDQAIAELSIGSVDLIKADIEGAELFLFEGAKSTLSGKHKPTIIFECYEPHCNSFDHSTTDVTNLLKSYGYDLEQFEEYQWIAKPQKK